MADSVCTQRILPTLAATALVALCMPAVCSADDGTQGAGAATTPAGYLQDARTFVLDGASRFETALKSASRRVLDGSPDWLRRSSGLDPFAGNDLADDDGARLVVQQDRPDGADLLTVRYVRGNAGSLQAYAGAGLSRTRYFDALTDQGPTLLVPRNGHSDVGAAAEAGAELRVSERLRFSADLRWADLHDDASVLRAAYGPVVADPVTLGLNVGYRFR
jgi:hypothetical protein